MPNRLPRALVQALDETGLEWEVTHGKRHLHVRLAGRMVAVLPTCRPTEKGLDRGLKNTIANIRRFARRLAEQTPQGRNPPCPM